MQRTSREGFQVHSVAFSLPPASKTSQFGPNVLTMIQKAFVAVDHREGPATPDNVVPALLLYNMGLSFHLQAVRTGKTSYIVRASEFYRYAMSLLEAGSARPKALMAALANNMGHISASMFHARNLKTAMTMLKNLMDDPTTERSLQEDELDILTMNWVFYSEYHHTALAAAA